MKLATFLAHVQQCAEQSGDSIPAILRKLRLVGIEGVEAWPEQLRETDLVQQVKDAGLSISGVPVWYDFVRKPFSQADVDLIGTIKAVGAPHLLLLPGLLEPGDDPDAAFEKNAEGFRAVAEACRREGIEPGIEDFDSERSILSSLAGVRALLDAVPELGFCLDTGNFIIRGEDPLDMFRTHGDRICRIHAKDRSPRPICGEWNLKVPSGESWYPAPVGAGRMPVAAVIREAKARGFDGWIVVENFGGDPLYPTLLASANYVTDLWRAQAVS